MQIDDESFMRHSINTVFMKVCLVRREIGFHVE